jgi:hypothetical protein
LEVDDILQFMPLGLHQAGRKKKREQKQKPELDQGEKGRHKQSGKEGYSVSFEKALFGANSFFLGNSKRRKRKI